MNTPTNEQIASRRIAAEDKRMDFCEGWLTYLHSIPESAQTGTTLRLIGKLSDELVTLQRNRTREDEAWIALDAIRVGESVRLEGSWVYGTLWTKNDRGLFDQPEGTHQRVYNMDAEHLAFIIGVGQARIITGVAF